MQKVMEVHEREYSEYDIDLEAWRETKPFGYSGCFRLRDEAQFMRAAILSHLPYLDEAVLVVQPSKDETLEKAKELESEYPDKVRVIYYPFDVHFIDHPQFKTEPENSIYSFVYLSNWALAQCKYSWICKVEGDVICLPTYQSILDRIAGDGQPWYYGRTLLNAAGENCDQFSLANPRNGGWDEAVFPNHPRCFFARYNKWEVLMHDLKAAKMGWSGIHMKRCKREFLPGPWNGEEYAELTPERLEAALEVHNREKGYTNDPDPLGIPELYEGWQEWLTA